MAARCNGKRVYKAESSAVMELKRMKRKVIDPFRLKHYWCEVHQGWHIGNVVSSHIQRLKERGRYVAVSKTPAEDPTTQ